VQDHPGPLDAIVASLHRVCAARLIGLYEDGGSHYLEVL